jgi:hypothetical protein
MIEDTNAHQMSVPDADGVITCSRCDLRHYPSGGVWQRKKGGHWRREAQQPIPACFTKERTPTEASSPT